VVLHPHPSVFCGASPRNAPRRSRPSPSRSHLIGCPTPRRPDQRDNTSEGNSRRCSRPHRQSFSPDNALRRGQGARPAESADHRRHSPSSSRSASSARALEAFSSSAESRVNVRHLCPGWPDRKCRNYRGSLLGRLSGTSTVSIANSADIRYGGRLSAPSGLPESVPFPPTSPVLLKKKKKKGPRVAENSA